MNTPKIIISSIATALLATTAGADELLSQKYYGDELDRCVSEAREVLGAAGDQPLRHTVTEVNKKGAWYRFEIQTQSVSKDGVLTPLGSTRCSANRFNSDTRADAVRSEPMQLAGI